MLLFSQISARLILLKQAGEQSLRYRNTRVIRVLYVCMASANCVAWLEFEEYR
jgi:hypothetical protein